jgi:hypothetical protein
VPRVRLVGMRSSMRGGAVRASSVQVVVGKRSSKSLELIRAKVREIVQQLTENLDMLFFDLKAGD